MLDHSGAWCKHSSWLLPHLGFTPFYIYPTWTCAISKPYMGHIWVTPVPKIGLWTWSPRCSAVFAHSEPTIHFSNCSAVSRPKTRDFRFRWRHFRSCDFPLCPRSYWPAVFRSYDNPSTNQKTKALDQSEASYLPIWAQCTTANARRLLRLKVLKNRHVIPSAV